MSGHHHDPVQDNIETHPVKLAIWIVIGTVALIIGIVLTAQLAVGFYGSRSMKGDPAMADAAIAKRIGPAAKLVVDPNAPAPAPAPAAGQPASTPVAAKAEPAANGGKATYDTTCSVCHAAGVAGAPKAGDKAAWSARLKAAKGKAGLYASSIKGKGAMPPKGGNASLSDDAVKAAVDYLLATAK